MDDGTLVIVTVHPPYLPRMSDRARAAEERKAFTRDLAAIGRYMESVEPGSTALDSENDDP
ncbi:hypothetical protein [Pelagibacterium sp.]|uniref:hypothetical protein n=1 Tax=Pelagibacterium sp. TaxID=1967288 RepID=UPI003BA8DBE5